MRLYLRIFIAFWLVIILVISSVLLINSQLDRAQRDASQLRDRVDGVEERLIQPATRALAEQGPEGLASWLEATRQDLRRVRLQIHDLQGQEITGKQPARGTERIVRQWQERDRVPTRIRRGILARTIEAPGRETHLLVINRPPVPLFVRVLGPLGPWGLLGLSILISGLICLWLARSISRPVQQMRSAGRELGRGRLSARIDPALARRHDELGDLAADFNRMAERLEKLVSGQRQLLRDVSHELRSPLARLQVSLALAGDSRDPTARDHYLERMEVETRRLNHLIGEILDYARLSETDESKLRPLDLADLLSDIRESASLEGRPRNVTTRLRAPDSCPITGDEELLHRALENVLRNALRYSPEGGEVTIDLDCPSPGESVQVIITDQGPGVPADQLESIFEPFVRLSSDRGAPGTGGGVGLAIAREAIRRHKGTIRAENRSKQGLKVTIRLPRNHS